MNSLFIVPWFRLINQYILQPKNKQKGGEIKIRVGGNRCTVVVVPWFRVIRAREYAAWKKSGIFRRCNR